MISLKVKSLWIRILRFVRARPLFLAGLVVLLLDICYVNLSFDRFSLNLSGGHVKLTGRVCDKSLDNEGFIKSITIYDIHNFDNEPLKTPGLYGRTCMTVYFSGANRYFFDDIKLGNTVSLTGSVKELSSPTNPGEFDFKKYNLSQKIMATVFASNVEIINSSEAVMGEFFKAASKKITASLINMCPVEGGTMNTILLGDREYLPNERKEMYEKLNLSHFLVVSGLHISALSGALYMILRRLRLRVVFAALSALLCTIFYGLLIGFTVSVTRAVIMFSILMFSRIVLKSYDSLSALSLSMIISIILNPLCILSSGFVYSYYCVFAIDVYMLNFRYTKSKVIIPLYIWIMVLPINMYYQSYATVTGTLANIILSLFSVILVILSFLAGFGAVTGLSLFCPVTDFIAASILKLMDLIYKPLSRLPDYKYCGRPGKWALFVYITMVLILIIFVKDRLSRISFCLLMLTISLILPYSTYKPFNIRMLDVGQGDCFIVNYVPGKAIIIDCGSSSDKSPGESILIPALKALGITKITDIYISHNDSDHINGLEYLINNADKEGIKVKRILMSNNSYVNLFDDCPNLYNAIFKQNIPVSSIGYGDIIKYGSTTVSCISPDNGISGAESNHASLVLWINHKSMDILCTGDQDAQSEADILKRGILNEDFIESKDYQIDVFKVAHHGSKGSSTEEYIKRIHPKIGLISVGPNSYGHPTDEVLGRLEDFNVTIYRSDVSGSVCVR